jgi:rRNA-processing protein EBP2
MGRDGGARRVCASDANAKTDEDDDDIAWRGVDFQWTHKAKWIDHMTITGTNEARVVDVNDDLARETFFYERALESANECVRRLKDLGVPVRRPDDYYAEMVKSDEHMKRVRSELLFEQQQLEIREERRKARESKKYGKQVQAEKIKQRTLDKKSQIKSLDKWRKQRQKSGFADDGKAPFEGAEGDAKRKRADRDSKYGFGGRKKVRLAPPSKRAGRCSVLRRNFSFSHHSGGPWGAARIPGCQRDEASKLHDVYLYVNTVYRLFGRRPFSRRRLPKEQDHIPLPRRARRRRNYVTGQTMGLLFTRL